MGLTRLDDTRCATYERRINYRTEAITSRLLIKYVESKTPQTHQCKQHLFKTELRLTDGEVESPEGRDLQGYLEHEKTPTPLGTT